MRASNHWRPRAMGMIIALAVTLTLAASAPARAGSDVDLRAGLYTDPDGLALGAGLLTPISSYGWYFNPNVELAVPDGGTLLTINGDVHYDFPTSGSISPYLGAGPSLLRFDPDFGDSHTDLGINVLAGVAAMRGQVRPFAQIKGVFADDSELALMGGVRF